MITKEQREFFATKNPAREFETIVIEHVDFIEPVRLVFNQFVPYTFGGNEYIPVAGKVTKPDQGSEPNPNITLQFSRIHVGDKLNEYIKAVNNWQEPFYVSFEQYSELDMTTPSVAYHKLNILKNGIRMNRNNVTISCGYDNPMTKGGVECYRIEVFPWLQRL
ncbi:DUF1833 family protein [Orbus sturtevantii]|uniref:DUF1833 family protein n=1 Tax=Orbus sturtevantii TaxID=3074109 RepID=UPI00370D6E12